MPYSTFARPLQRAFSSLEVRGQPSGWQRRSRSGRAPSRPHGHPSARHETASRAPPRSPSRRTRMYADGPRTPGCPVFSCVRSRSRPSPAARRALAARLCPGAQRDRAEGRHDVASVADIAPATHFLVSRAPTRARDYDALQSSPSRHVLVLILARSGAPNCCCRTSCLPPRRSGIPRPHLRVSVRGATSVRCQGRMS